MVNDVLLFSVNTRLKSDVMISPVTGGVNVLSRCHDHGGFLSIREVVPLVICYRPDNERAGETGGKKAENSTAKDISSGRD